MNQHRRLLLGSLLSLPAVAAWGQASLAQPAGPVVVTVAGAIRNTNRDKTAVFDLDMLEALPQRTVRTATPWHSGVVAFSGPTGVGFLDAVGVTGQTLVISALNDYKVRVPVQDLRQHGVVLATRLNGERMRVRDKGPLFLIYPFDDNPALKSEVYFNRSIWQIKSILVE
ncbi:MAG: hypothetical protein RL758_508 [Pseudomonadota bacterium]|jgi:hypothetical protein